MASNRTHGIRGTTRLEQLTGEARTVVRGLRRDVWFSVGIIATVGTALAANAALVTFLNGYFWKPLPIPRVADHVEIAGRDAAGRVNGAWASAHASRIVEGAAPVLEQVYAVAERRAAVVPPGGKEPQPAVGAVVTREYFALVEPHLAIGRLPFAPAGGGEDAAGIVLSDAGWRRLAASRRDVVGEVIRIDDAFFTVTGVMTPSVIGLEPITPDFWILANTYELAVGPLDHGYVVGGLLRSGITASAASEAMTTVVRSLPSLERAAPPKAAAVVLPRTTLTRERTELAPLILTLLVAFALMTLVACANLSGIYHARVAGRTSDFSIRFALGASRGRIVRQVLLEGVVLACIGGMLACAGAWLTVDRLQGHVFSMVIQAGLTMAPVTVDGVVCLYTMLLAVAVGAVCALTPALAALSAQPGAPGEGGLVRGGGRSHRTLQRLVVAQAGISLTLLLAAGIVVKNATRAQQVEIGYDLAPLVDLGFERLTPARVEQFLLDPRVADATTVSETPLAGQLPRVTVRVNGHSQRLRHNVVDHRFFETLRIPILGGRAFVPADAAEGVRRVVVSASAARLLWPGQDPVGRDVDLDVSETEMPRWERHEVVGVAADALGGFFFEGREVPTLYLPAPVASARTQQLVARVPGGSATRADLRALCRAYDPDALCRPMTVRALLDRQQVPFTVAAEIASSLGGVTLVLACIGLYGLVSFSVVRQTRDIGIRMALGATQRGVLADILRGAGRRMLHGAAFGLPAAGALLALLEWQVPMIETFDPVVFVLVPALLLAAGVATALVPARRAARVDPIVALRRDG